MKILVLVLVLLNLSSCAILAKPETLYAITQNVERMPANEQAYEWDLDPKNKEQMESFWKSYNDCKEFAFKSKVMGSKYFESDIHTACLGRKGYKTRKVIASK